MLLFKLCLHSINFILKYCYCFSYLINTTSSSPPSLPSYPRSLSPLVFLSLCFASEIQLYSDGGQIVLVAIFSWSGSLFFSFLLHVIRFHTKRIYCFQGSYNYIGLILIMHDFLPILKSLTLSANFLLPYKVTYLQLLANQALIVIGGILPTALIMRGNHSSYLTIKGTEVYTWMSCKKLIRMWKNNIITHSYYHDRQLKPFYL